MELFSKWLMSYHYCRSTHFSLHASGYSLFLLIFNKFYIFLLRFTVPENRRNHYVEKIAYALAMYVAGAIASLLLIWGARKMRPFAMIPAILCVVAAIACTIFYLGLNLVTMPFGHFQLLEHLVPLLGVEVLIFYVVVALFREIRRFKLEQQKHEGPQNPNYYDKI
ncbi:uncharacterized protein isoform X2 [Musca autumnalis]|uniref:uncharacterized protein isoform X2 n=1 Tax=Musca autumnalis TaxID=221902 RepID=UPI003CF32C65